MSLVMAFATEYFTVISGDFRRTHIEDDDIFYDDTPKVFSVNSRVSAGFTGDCDISKHLIQRISSLGQNSTVEAVARFIRKTLKSIQRLDIHQTVILTGISDSGKIVILQMSHRDKFKIKKTTVKPGEIRWLYAYSYVDPEESIESLFGQLTDCNSENIHDMAKKVNVNVSLKDPRVSPACEAITIIKNN